MTDEEKEKVIIAALETEEGRVELAQKMAEAMCPKPMPRYFGGVVKEESLLTNTLSEMDSVYGKTAEEIRAKLYGEVKQSIRSALVVLDKEYQSTVLRELLHELQLRRTGVRTSKEACEKVSSQFSIPIEDLQVADFGLTFCVCRTGTDRIFKVDKAPSFDIGELPKFSPGDGKDYIVDRAQQRAREAIQKQEDAEVFEQ
jgi:PleD family two-component response regulator